MFLSGMLARKPHPRSLDALFPKPKKPAVKRCARGHRQNPDWREGKVCVDCALYDEATLRIRNHAAERAAWQAANPTPIHLTIQVVSTGRTIRFTIPKGQQRNDQAHRPGRKRRIYRAPR